jgi:2'-hydroxyisoflavone reductase
MLAPGNPAQPTQVIDERDLSDWTIGLIEGKKIGAYNATGPDYTLTWGDFLQTCKEVSGSDINFVWVDQDFLASHELRAGVELPIWTPDNLDYAGFAKVDCSKAIADNLTFRPLAETVRDTLAWDNTRSHEKTYLNAIKPEKEVEVLAAYQQA